MSKKIEEITGLKKPTQEDFRFPISENDEELMINYAYGLLDYAEDLERYIEQSEERKEKVLEFVENELDEAYILNKKATDLNNDATLLLEEYDPTQDWVNQNSKLFNVLHEQWYNVLLKQGKVLNGLHNCFENNFRFINKEGKKMYE